jgi:hypothetical protein
MWRIQWVFLVGIVGLFGAPPIEKVVIWGHKLHSHTHSYIHERFFRAFQHLGYKTYWFDAKDDTRGFDFSHCLFITEGQVDQNIPLRFDCQYVLHNCSHQKYQELFEASLAIVMQVYTDDVLTRPTAVCIAPCIYYDVMNKCVYFPWASDYLPHEIDALKTLVAKRHIENYVPWIGTISSGIFGNENEIRGFKEGCTRERLPFLHKGGLDRDVCTNTLLQAYMAPTIVGHWQQEKGYIPCRIFINICCGQMGITNSLRTYELFDKKIVYNPDSYQLFRDAQNRRKTWTLQEQYELMDMIKEKHTYINRIQTLLEFLNLSQQERH